jgi:protein-tyrosine phosphatase
LIEWVDEHVAIGNWIDARDSNVLRNEGIDLIIDARSLFDDRAGRSLRTPRLELIVREADILIALGKTDAKVLVRCHHGRDRSPFVAMVYLSRKRAMSYHDAYHLVKQKRPMTVFHWDWVKLLESFTPGPVEDQR